MVGVEPVHLLARHQRLVDELAVDRAQRDRLEAVPGARRRRQLLVLRHEGQVLDADAEAPVLVVARLDRHQVALHERGRHDVLEAVRPLVNAEVLPHAVAGAVVVVAAGQPQVPAGEHLVPLAGGAGRERGQRAVDVAHQHAREHLLLAGRRLAEGDGARDVGGALEVLAAAVDQVDALPPQPAVRLLRGAVVDDRAVGTEAADRAEAAVLAVPILPPELPQLVGGRDLGDVALGHGALEPVQEAHHGHAVAAVRLGDGLDLHLVLDRAHGHQRRDRAVQRRLAEGVGDPAVGRRRVDPHRQALPAERGQVRPHLAIGRHLRVRTQLALGRAVDLARVHVQRAPAVGDDRIGRDHRRERDVVGADVQQPGDLVQRADDVRLDAGLLHRLAQARQLGLRRLAREAARVDRDRGQALGRAVGPQGIDRVAAKELHVDAARGQGVCEVGRRGHRDHAGIDAQDLAGAKLGCDPRGHRRRARLAHPHQLDVRAGQLLACLQEVAPVRPQAGPARADHQFAHRAGEAAQPGAVLPGVRQVLALVGIGTRHVQGMDPQLLQLAAQGRHLLARGHRGPPVGYAVRGAHHKGIGARWHNGKRRPGGGRRSGRWSGRRHRGPAAVTRPAAGPASSRTRSRRGPGCRNSRPGARWA